MSYMETHPYKSYWCIYCKRQLVTFDGVFVHDDVPHPLDMTFDEEENPQ